MTYPQLMALSAILFTASAATSSTRMRLAQEQEQRQLAGSFQESAPNAGVRWRTELTVGPEPLYAVLADRIALANLGDQTIRFLGLDGQLLGEAPVGSPLSRMSASSDGLRLLATSRLNEDEALHAIFDPEGRLLWSARLGSDLEFSPDGRFLLTRWDALDASQLATVFRSDTGEKVWEDEENPPYWQMAAAANGTAAYYRRGALRLIDLNAGEVLWERDVPADRNDMGKVLISRNGERIVVQTHVVDATDALRTFAYDARANMSWENLSEVDPGQSNGGALDGISESGQRVAVADLDHFAILSGSDGLELSRLDGPMACCVAAFTDELLILDQGSTARILRLDPSGQVLEDSVVEGSIRLRRVSPASGGYVARVVTQSGTRLSISEIEEAFLGRPPANRPGGIER